MKCIAIALVLALTASTALAQNAPTPSFAQNAQTPSNVNLASASAAALPAPPERQNSNIYRLGPGDQLHIIVYGETDLTGDFTVSPVGTIAYPLIGEVPVNGLTPDQMSQAI